MRRGAVRTAVVISVGLITSACGGSSSGPSTPQLRAADTTTTAAPDTTATTEAGGSDSSVPNETTTRPTTTPTTPAESPLPSVEVLDVATGDTIDFADFLPSDTPVLFWFWAPH
jgi:hypothetical protein